MTEKTYNSLKFRRTRGFTLVETLVGLSLFVLIMVMVTGIFFQVLKDTKRTGSVMSAYDGVRMFSTQIAEELGSVMVRVNDERWLNFKVEEKEEGTAVFFTSPDDSVRSISSLNFISHYAYYWDKEDRAIYRAVYNTTTDPSFLESTAADPDNKNRSANQKRLTAMTLAYRSGSPYGWTSSREMEELMDQELHQAVLQDVYGFDVRSFQDLKRNGDPGETMWNDHTSLPLFVEIEIRVADEANKRLVEYELETKGELSEETEKKLRRFLITVPMTNRDINDNRVYQ